MLVNGCCQFWSKDLLIQGASLQISCLFWMATLAHSCLSHRINAAPVLLWLVWYVLYLEMTDCEWKRYQTQLTRDSFAKWMVVAGQATFGRVWNLFSLLFECHWLSPPVLFWNPFSISASFAYCFCFKIVLCLFDCLTTVFCESRVTEVFIPFLVSWVRLALYQRVKLCSLFYILPVYLCVCYLCLVLYLVDLILILAFACFISGLFVLHILTQLSFFFFF